MTTYKDRSTRQANPAADAEVEADLIDVLTDVALRDVRERSKTAEKGDIIEASDGRKYKVGHWHDGDEWPRLTRLYREGDDDLAAAQRESRNVIRLDKAVAKFMREGLDEGDFDRMNQIANRRASQPVDQGRLSNKLGHAVEQMVDLILNGEVNPRSAAEAANVAEALVRIAGTLKVDGAALAAAVAWTGEAMDRRAQFHSLLDHHLVGRTSDDNPPA